MRGLVKSVGPGKDRVMDIHVGDVVYVYPNQFEATFALNGIGYLIYPERNIIAKDKSGFTTSSLYQA
jgi:co-chaperonin GroES (HSP10)